MPSLKHLIVNIIGGLALVSFILFCGCGKKQDIAAEKTEKKLQNNEILAWVGEKVITKDDYGEELAMLPPAYRNIASLQKEQFLESLINKHLLLQEAQRKNLQDSKNVKMFFQKAKEEILIQELINTEISDKAAVSDGEIEKYYSEHQDEYIEPAKIRASHILVDSEVVAKKISADLQSGVDFSELAKEYSLDIPTKDKGGDLGYFTKGAFLVEFQEACDKLQTGQISDAVKTELGYHIIKITDRKEASHKTLDEVKDTIKNELFLDKQLTLYENLLQNLKEKQKVTVNKEALERIDITPTPAF